MIDFLEEVNDRLNSSIYKHTHNKYINNYHNYVFNNSL